MAAPHGNQQDQHAKARFCDQIGDGATDLEHSQSASAFDPDCTSKKHRRMERPRQSGHPDCSFNKRARFRVTVRQTG